MNAKLFRTCSLKARVTLFTLAIFLVSLWSLGSYASLKLRHDMQHQLGERQSSTVSFIAEEINHEIYERFKTLEKVAASVVPATLANSTALQRFLEQREDLQEPFNAGVVVYGLDGTVVADVPVSKAWLGINFLNRDFLLAALNEGRSTISQSVMGDKPGVPVVVMATPIRDGQGKVLGALSGITNLKLPNFLNFVAQNGPGKTGGYLLISPQRRQIIVATDKRQVMQTLPAFGANLAIDHLMQGHEGAALMRDSLGLEVLASSKNIPAAGWVISSVLPAQEAFAPINDTQQHMLLATVLLTLLAGGLTWWMLQRELRPLVEVAKTLTLLSQSEQTPHPLPIARQDEIGLLIGGFNRLLAKLGRREERLQQSEERYRTLTEFSPEAITVHRDGQVLYVNTATVALLGARSAGELIGRRLLDLVHPKYHAIFLAGVKQVTETGGSLPMIEEVFLKLDGTAIDVEVQGTPIAYDGEPAIYMVMRDITEYKRAQERLHLSASVFTHASEGIMITAADGAIINVNGAFTRITGYERDDVLGQNPRLLSSGRQSPEYYITMWRELLECGQWCGEIWNRRKNGKVYAQMQTISAVRDESGRILHYLSLFSDISALKAQQQQLEHVAHFDALTNLPNRVLLADRMQHAMAQARRRGVGLAVAYLDLDGFKAINDQHGHHAGDKFLKTVASRMKQALREGDTLARLGGDEFVIVLQEVSDVSACVPMLNRLLAAASLETVSGEMALQVTASVGVTFYPQSQNLDADQLLRQADQSMYQAKLNGKNRIHFFDAEQDHKERGHQESLDRIGQALAKREFVLYYQPKVNMRTGAVVGAEALIRWQHPEQGLLAPALFLPTIENHALAVEISEWVIDTALTQIEDWQATGLNLPVSVNVGARQLQQADFVTRFQSILAAHPTVGRDKLELELLETSALADLAHVSKVIESCRAIGVTFALDDFGTGYSSLTYLKRFPVTLLKIDRSFVRGMIEDAGDRAILEGVLGLARAFDREVIAEGVETVAHGTLLLQLGCELGQGYAIARPMPAADLPAWAVKWCLEPLWAARAAGGRADLSVVRAISGHGAPTVVIRAFLRLRRKRNTNQALNLSNGQANRAVSQKRKGPPVSPSREAGNNTVTLVTANLTIAELIDHINDETNR